MSWHGRHPLPSEPSFKLSPDDFVVFSPAAAVKGGFVGDGSFHRAAKYGVVDDGVGDGAGLHVLDVVPFWPGKADSGKAFRAGEDDAAILAVPGVRLILAHDWKLYPVNGFQLFKGQTEGHGGEHINLHQSLTASVVGTQGVVSLPGRSEIGKEGVGEARIRFGPEVVLKVILPALLPEVGVVGGETI